MKTLARPQNQLYILSLNDNVDHFQDNLTNSKSILDIRLYQKLFLIFMTLFIFLIFPESPKDLDAICHKHNSPKVCNVW